MVYEQTLTIPQDILASACLTLDDLKVELAVHLYEEGRLSVGKARELAGMSLWTFRHLLASLKIPVQYSVEDLENDVQTLRRLGQI